MPENSSMFSRIFGRTWIILLVAAIIIPLDQWTKELVRQNIAKFDYIIPIPALGEYFVFEHVDNHGAAFGILQGAGSVFIVIAAVVTVGVFYYAIFHLPDDQRLIRLLLGFQVGLKDRPQHKHGRCLRHPVPHSRYTQRPGLAGLFLRDQNLSHRLWRVGPFPQVPRQFPEPPLHAVRLDIAEALPVDPGLTAIAAGQSPGLQKKVLPPNLVAQGMKAPSGFFLRFHM